MKNKKTILGVVLLIAILLLGVGYAAISGYNLTIGGSAAASGNTDNFIVKFTNATTGTHCTKAEISTSDANARTATMEVSGLTTAGDTATATFEVTNESPELNAILAVTTKEMTGTDAGYFTIDTTIADNTTSMDPNATRTVTVTVKLNKTVVEDKTATINVVLSATPEETK